MKVNENKIKEILERGVGEIIEKEHLERALKSGKKLKIKFGIDPTSPDLHLGHAVLLMKLKQFQDAGHIAVFIIGDFTAQIGDPTGRDDVRKPLSTKEINNNLKKHLSLAGKIIDIKKAKIFYNSKWFNNIKPIFLELAKIGSIQQAMRREDFKSRMAKGNDITLLEAMYSLFQGYDSVMVGADVEIGGADQKLNLLSGRKLQRYFNKPEQDILTMPLLIGTDGSRKMSKSLGNYVGLDESPENMFAKIMTIPDELIENYFTLLTRLSLPEVRVKYSKPIELKKYLALEIVKLYHNDKSANKASENFERTFSKKETPENIKTYIAKTGEAWEDFLIRNNFAKSKSELKRLISGGGIDIDGKKIEKTSDTISEGILKIGKHRFAKIIFE